MDLHSSEDNRSPLQRLKDLPEAEHEFLLEQRQKKVTAVKLIAQLEARHGIRGLNKQRLSDFWRWLEDKRFLRQQNEDIENFREAYMMEQPGSSWKQAHLAAISWLSMKAGRTDDAKLGAKVLAEIRRAMALDQGDVRLQIEQKRLAIQEAAARAKEAVTEAGKRLEFTPEVMREILEAVDKKILGIE